MTSSAVHHMTKAELAQMITQLQAKVDALSVPAAVRVSPPALSMAMREALSDTAQITTTTGAIATAMSVALSAEKPVKASATTRAKGTRTATTGFAAIAAAVVANPAAYNPQPFRPGYERIYPELPEDLVAVKPQVVAYAKQQGAAHAAVIGEKSYTSAARFSAALWSRITLASGFRATIGKKTVRKAA